jgi:hypothetical protein
MVERTSRFTRSRDMYKRQQRDVCMCTCTCVMYVCIEFDPAPFCSLRRLLHAYEQNEFVIEEVIRSIPKGKYTWDRVSFPLCEWTRSPLGRNGDTHDDPVYFTIDCLCDLNDPPGSYFFRIREGHFCDLNKRILESDKFLDIKTDPDSMKGAIVDIEQGRIPLVNIVKFIDTEQFPYATTVLMSKTHDQDMTFETK